MASVWMTLGALMLLPLLAMWYGAFVCYGPACGAPALAVLLPVSVSVALVASPGGLLLQSRVDKLRRAFGAPAPPMALRSVGCVLSFLLAVVSLILLVGV